MALDNSFKWYYTNVLFNYNIMFHLDFTSKKMKGLIVLACLVGAVFSAAIDDNEVSKIFIFELNS